MLLHSDLPKSITLIAHYLDIAKLKISYHFIVIDVLKSLYMPQFCMCFFIIKVVIIENECPYTN